MKFPQNLLFDKKQTISSLPQKRMVQTLSFLLVVFCFVVVSLGQASNPPLWPSCQDGAFCNTDIQNGTEHVQRIIYPDGTVTLNSCQHVPYIGDVCFDISISPLGSFYDNIVIQLTIDSLKVWTLNTTIPGTFFFFFFFGSYHIFPCV